MAPNDPYEDPPPTPSASEPPSPAPDRQSDTVEGDADGADPDADPLADLVREPQQARSRKTLSRIMAAADTLLLERGPDALTVAAIARRARASVGSFYARFDGKEELVRYLGETALQAAAEDWSDRFNEALGQALAEVAQGSDGTEGEEARALLGPLRDLAQFLLESLLSGPPSRLERLDRIEDPVPTRLERFQGRVLQDLEELFARVAGSGEIQGQVAARIMLSAVRALASEEGLPASGASVTASPSVAATEVARATSLYLAARPPTGVPEVRQPSTQAAEEAPAEPPTYSRPVPESTAEPQPDDPEVREPLPWEGTGEPPPKTTPREPRGEPEETPAWGELAWEYPETRQPEPGEPEPGEPEPGEPEPGEPEPREPGEPEREEPAPAEPATPQPAPPEPARPEPRAKDERVPTPPAAAATEEPPAAEEPTPRPEEGEGDDEGAGDDEDAGDVEIFDVWG